MEQADILAIICVCFSDRNAYKIVLGILI